MSEDNNLVCIEEMAQNCYVCWPFFPRITREKDKCIHIRYVEFLYNGMVLETRLLWHWAAVLYPAGNDWVVKQFQK